MSDTSTPQALPTTTERERIRTRALHMMGDDVAASWDADQALAWEGMLELARRLRRRAEDTLMQDHDLSVSMLGMMGRLRGADRCTLRQSALAEAMGLSVSRASRVIDLLEERGVVKRTPCPSDGRATNVTLTDAGIERAASAQHALFVMVSGAFAERLSPEETATLAQVFGRLLADA